LIRSTALVTGVVGAVLAALPGCDRAREDPRLPNVLLVSVDTLRPDFLGMGGDPNGTSPVLDRLSARGVLFTGARATSSWTLPSHMSLFTGQYPSSHGVFGDGRSLPSDRRTLAQLLREEGYRTGGFVSGPYLHRAYGFDRGFDVYAHCMDYVVEVTPEGRVANLLRARQLSHRGITGPAVDEEIGEWLDGIPPGEPYFLFAHYWDPHYDFEPPFPWDTWLDPDYGGRFRAIGFLNNRRISPDMPAERKKRLHDLYRGEIRYTDGWIGALLDRVEARGETGRTLVIVVGDHGEEFFEHGEKGHRNNLYEETLRIPMIVSLPGLFAGGRMIAEPVSLVDVWSTVEGLLGRAPSAEGQGVDLGAVLARSVPRDGIVAELHRDLIAFVTAGWKAIADREGGGGELYSLDDDPGERRDLRETEGETYGRLMSELESTRHDRFAPEDLPIPALDEGTEERLRALGYTE
jgi:arylsulfatase